MSSLVREAKAEKLTFDTETMWVNLTDGRIIGIPMTYFPKLLHATVEQRKKFIISGGGIGLHWDDLDEDISVEGLLLGHWDRKI